MIGNYKHFNNDYKKSSNLFLFGLIALVFGFHTSVIAQVSGVNEGDRVRIKAPGVHSKSIVGTVYDVSSTGVLLSAKDSSLTIPFSSVERLDVRVGKKRNAGKGALIGAVAGGVILGSVAKSSNGSGEDNCDSDQGWLCFNFNFFQINDGLAFAGGALLGTLGGGLIGGVLGSFVKSDRWERMQVGFSRELIVSPDISISQHPSISVTLSLSGNHLR